MKTVKKILLNIFVWFLWKDLHMGLKTVLGHKTLSASIQEMKTIENKIRIENELLPEEVITWENSRKTTREIFAKYVTLKHFNTIGTLLAYFKSVDKKLILKE